MEHYITLTASNVTSVYLDPVALLAYMAGLVAAGVAFTYHKE